MPKITLICPISTNLINEKVVRIIAFLISIITTITLYNLSLIGAVLLIYDFSIRGFTDGKYSPVKQLALLINKHYIVGNQPIDAAPKQFAAKLGVLFTFLIAFFILMHFTGVATFFGALLVICAALEAFFSVCIGCYIYLFFVRIDRH
jgi:hypothetical protein